MNIIWFHGVVQVYYFSILTLSSFQFKRNFLIHNNAINRRGPNRSERVPSCEIYFLEILLFDLIFNVEIKARIKKIYKFLYVLKITVIMIS